MMVRALPDLEVQSKSQVFPRFYYKTPEVQKGGIFEDAVDVPEGYELHDNISDSALEEYQSNYKDNQISKDDIFFYIYGLLHSRGYRKKYANDLVKGLPRIPMAPDFWAFSEAGRKLGYLHCFYEDLKGHSLEMETNLLFEEENDNHWRFKKLKWADKETKSTLIINDHITLTGIPPKAHEYIVNGKSGLGWIVECYQIRTDTKESGITNDPNNLFGDPRDFIKLIKQVVQVSIETVDIVNTLPTQFEPRL